MPRPRRSRTSPVRTGSGFEVRPGDRPRSSPPHGAVDAVRAGKPLGVDGCGAQGTRPRRSRTSPVRTGSGFEVRPGDRPRSSPPSLGRRLLARHHAPAEVDRRAQRLVAGDSSDIQGRFSRISSQARRGESSRAGLRMFLRNPMAGNIIPGKAGSSPREKRRKTKGASDSGGCPRQDNSAVGQRQPPPPPLAGSPREGGGRGGREGGGELAPARAAGWVLPCTHGQPAVAGRLKCSVACGIGHHRPPPFQKKNS